MKRLFTLSLALLLGVAVGGGVASLAGAEAADPDVQPPMIQAPHPDEPVIVGDGRGRFDSSRTYQELLDEVARQAEDDSTRLADGSFYSYGLLSDGSIGPIEICRERQLEADSAVRRDLGAAGFEADVVTECEPLARR